MKRLSRVVMAVVAVAGICTLAIAGIDASQMRRSANLLPGVGVSQALYDARGCTSFGILMTFSANDTVEWFLDYSIDGVTYTCIDSTQVNNGAAGSTTFKQYAHTATVGANNTVHFGDFIYPILLIRLENRSVADTAATVTSRLVCGN